MIADLFRRLFDREPEADLDRIGHHFRTPELATPKPLPPEPPSGIERTLECES